MRVLPEVARTMTAVALCAALGMVGAACSSGDDGAADDVGAAEQGVDASASSGDGVAASGAEAVAEPSPPRLPDDFTWTGRYLVPDLDVEVPFTWHGRDGDFQMVAGGEGEPIHFTNLIVDGELYTLTYEWPDLERRPCSHVGASTVEEFNEGLAEAAYVGRETLHENPPREVHHYRATSVLELPPELIPELEGVQLRVPLMAGDIYVDVDDASTFWKVLHFGLQNLYDPNLDEWIVIDEADSVAGEVDLPQECADALAASQSES